MKKTAQLAGLAAVVTGLTAWGIWDSIQPKEYDRFLQPERAPIVSKVKTNKVSESSMSTDTNSAIYPSTINPNIPYAINNDRTPGTVDKTNAVIKQVIPAQPQPNKTQNLEDKTNGLCPERTENLIKQKKV